MGVFVNTSPFTDINIANLFVLTSIQQLFLLGGIAIAVGFLPTQKSNVHCWNDLLKLSPVSAFVVFYHSIVLFLFASQGISSF